MQSFNTYTAMKEVTRPAKSDNTINMYKRSKLGGYTTDEGHDGECDDENQG